MENMMYIYQRSHYKKFRIVQSQNVEAVDPQEAIIPMHTENVAGFKELAIDERYKKMIRSEI